MDEALRWGKKLRPGTAQRVGAGAASDRVIAAVAADNIVAVVALDHVSVVAPGDGVVAKPAVHLVHARPAVDRVAAEHPEQNVVARATAQRVVLDVSLDPVVAVANGTGLRALGAGRTDAAWSPDGKRIAFSAKVGGNYDIYTMRADGTGVTRVTTSPREDAKPTWSPDGKQLAFRGCTFTGGDYSEPICDIYRLRSTAPYGRAVKLTDSKVNPTSGPCARYSADRQTWQSVTWRPNGAQLAVSRLCHYDYEPGWFEPEIISAVDGRTTRSLDGDLSGPAWSPNGSKLTWLDYDQYNDGGAVRQLPIRVVTGEDAPVVLHLHNSRVGVDYRGYRGTLYVLDTGAAAEGPISVREWDGYLRLLDKMAEIADNRLIIDGQIWRPAPEPRYVVMSYGIGGNHGGTGLSTSASDNTNVLAASYFRADSFEAARAHALAVAARDYNTKSIPAIERMTPEIEIIDPAWVRLTVPPAESDEVDAARNALQERVDEVNKLYNRRDRDNPSTPAAEQSAWDGMVAARSALAALTSDLTGALPIGRPQDAPPARVVLGTLGADGHVDPDTVACMYHHVAGPQFEEGVTWVDLTGDPDVTCPHGYHAPMEPVGF